MLNPLPRIALVVLLFASCGKGGNKKNEKHDAAPVPVAAPISLPTLGVDKITRFSFGDTGRAKDFEKKGEWQEVRKLAEAAVTKDATNFDAQRLLGIALANTGEQAAAVDHLVAAIAGDYYKYGVALASEPALKDFLTTKHGEAVTQLATQIRDEYAKRIKTALLLVGRRSAFKWPDKAGAQSSYSRGEVYAYDRDNKRYYRLTHTGDQVAGFIVAKAGNEIAALGYDKVDHPKEPAPPLVARGWVQSFDTAEWKNTSPKMQLNPARAIAINYGDGDQLLVGAAPASGRWDVGAWTMWSVDRTTGKLTKVTTPLGARIELTLDEGRIIPGKLTDGVTATWTGEPGRAPQLEIAKGVPPVHVPESGQAAQETVTVAPGGGFVAFATAVDPCSKDAAPSLYVVNGKSGALKHVLTAKSRFSTRWIDATTLAYEDGDGAIRIFDATASRESQRLENKPGLALAVLSLAPAPLCKQAPPTAETGSDELPPEEGSAAPVTKPQ